VKIPEDEESVEALTFSGLLDALCDFERRLRKIEILVCGEQRQ